MSEGGDWASEFRFCKDWLKPHEPHEWKAGRYSYKCVGAEARTCFRAEEAHKPHAWGRDFGWYWCDGEAWPAS